MTAAAPTPWPLSRKHPDHKVGDRVLVSLPGHPLFGGTAQITRIDCSEHTGLAIHTVNHIENHRLYGDEIQVAPHDRPADPDAQRIWDLARQHGWMAHLTPDGMALISPVSPVDWCVRRVHARWDHNGPAGWTCETFDPHLPIPPRPERLDAHHNLDLLATIITANGDTEDL